MIGVISRSTMATGVTKASKGSSSEPRRPLYRSNPTDEDQLLNWNDLFDDRLNNLADWRPSSTFANQLRKEKKKKEPNRDRDREILQSAEASPSSRREKKRKEPNRDREMPLSAESPPSSSALRHHTPATYPRTQFSSVTTAAERSAIESLKQRLTFSETDDQSTDAEGAHAAANNERDVSRQRLLQPLQAQESNLLNDLDVPDRNQIVARLMQIRDYQKQASAMLSNLQNSTDRATNTDQLRKLERLIDHLKDQEKGYTGLLQRMLTDDPGLLAAQPNQENNSGESNTTSLAESTSINIDAQSDISEATTEGEFTMRTRPQIESQLGDYRYDQDGFSDSDLDDRNPASESTLTADVEELNPSSLLSLNLATETSLDETLVPSTTAWKSAQSTTSSASSLSSKVENVSVDTNEEEIDPAIQQEELEGLRQQHELLKKMVKQQEELRALQGRQQSLLQLQRQIESQLAETQREHDDNRDRDRQPPRERPQDKESNVRWRERDQGRGDRDDDTASQQTSTTDATTTTATATTTDQSESSLPEPGLDLDVERRRLNLLQLLAEDREKRAAELMSARAADQRDRDSQLLAMASEHQELQDKLQALQEKKQQMDNLLQHLHTLRDQQLNNLDADSASASSSQQRINESIQATASANQTPHDATQELLDALEAREKLEKLREVRDRLNRLRDLVQYYQSGNEFIHSEPNPNEHTEETSSMADYEDPILMRNLRQLQREDVTRVSRQDRRESEISESTRGESQQRSDDGEEDEEEEEETEDMVDGNESNPGDKSDSENEEAESNHSSLLGAWGDDPEIQEKVKKLKAAKRKLRRLQELVAMVQQTPEAAEALPDDLAELAASIDGDIAADYDLDARGRRLSGQGKVDEKTREAYYMAKMRQQRGELSKLMEERQRLMTVQQQLKSLNEHFPQATLGKNPGGTRKRPTSAGTRSRRAMDSPRVSLPEGSAEVESCNRELWSEMRRHKILREELRQKRKELEILLQESRRQRAMDNQSDRGTFSIQSDNNDGYGMSADVTTQATWGGSTTHLSDIDDEEVDDGYPSDGIVQVEEEEEQEDTSDHDTYTIEADYRHRLRRPQTSSEIVTSQQKKRKLMNEDEPTSRRPFSAGDRVYHSRWPFMGSIRPTRQQQENVRSAEELIQEDQKREDPKDTQSQLLLWQCQQLQQQLNTSTSLCHSLIRDMQSLTTLVQSSQTGNPSSMGYGAVPATPYGISPTSPPTPFNPPPSPFNETMHSYNMQLQQQQLMLNLNQAYNQLYAQQLEIRALQEHFQQLSTRDNENQNNSTAGSLRMPHSLDESRASSRPQFANQGVSPYARAHSSLNSQFNLTPQFPATFSYPSTYANHYDERLYASGNRRSADTAGYPRYERYDTSGRYDYLQLFQEANRNPWQDDAARTFPRRHEANDEDEADEEEEEGQAEEERRDFSRVPPLNLDDILKRAEKRRAARSQGNPAAVVTHVQSPDVVGTKFPSRTEATRNLAQKDRSKNPRAAYLSGYRPGLSSGISGTAFIDTASISSAMSSVPGALNDDGNRTGRSMKSTSDVDSDAPSDFSLFEALRENIYSEVATLISQNESRPHYLIELFRELQMLTSDYLRQRALYAVQDLVSRYLTEESLSRPLPSVPRPAWQASTNSEQTPSESIVTSDDEEVRARLYAQNPNLFGYTEPTISSYDYAENVSSASSLSTPTNSHVDSFGFANDDLGNTVIHLDKAMQRMREYERMKAEAEVEGKGASSSLSTPAKKDRTSDLTSNSSAQDVGSESSVSDVPYPRIDTGQLDRQIKNIMQEVIPYLKEHMDDVCSPQLLAYIRRLVLTLTRQRGDSQEFVRFFNKQLGSILQDSLSKFAGRKMRECGEDLLVDISEILFNELAFFRLMQDLDSTGVGVMSRRHEDSETTGTDTGAGQTGTGEGDLFALLSMALSSQSGESTSEESDDEESSDEDSDSGSSDGEEEEEEKELQNVETAMAITPAEEEELGKVARDDAMAANFDVNDKDEDSETMATKTVKIELSVSESKPHTSTGSGEEDEEQDTVSEVQEYTTTIMAATAANEGFDAEIQDTQAAESATKQKEQSEEEKEEDTTEKVETMEEKEEDSAQKAETAENPAEDPAPTEVHVLQVNGDSAAQDKEDENEVTIDDLPGSLTSLSQIQLQEKMDEEQAGNTAVQAALEVLESGGESELAGDADSLKNPDASLPEDAVEGKAQSNQISNDESESE
ncbi:pericentriolar material 1 protein-like isoform X5 [Ptychodera flava]|uniref:pericentriolar material 1 protein-like isoform X5 n=1 Tax=Ptychodera flava TaxID=63121 RepID=UPI00396A2E37